MSIPIKIMVSLGVLVIGLLLLYSSAYAFGISSSLRDPLQLAMVMLTLVGIGLIWRGWLTWAGVALGAVVLIYGVILALNR
jgi:hypothetical protein